MSKPRECPFCEVMLPADKFAAHVAECCPDPEADASYLEYVERRDEICRRHGLYDKARTLLVPD